MFCSLSGEIPIEPVITKSGHLFEKHLIVKYIDTYGKCPITAENLTPADLISVQINKTIPPRLSSNSSIPNLIGNIQSEWDILMNDTYNIKKHLDITRQELSNSLYQNDAACRVIARLRKENMMLRNALAENKSVPTSNNNDMEIEKPVTADYISEFSSFGKTLSSERKIRSKQPTPELVLTTTINTYKTQSSHGVHKKDINTLDLSNDENVVLTGSTDNTAVLYKRDTGKFIDRLSGHKGAIISAKFINSSIITGSNDSTTKVWTAKDGRYENTATNTTHSDSIVGVSVHPTGKYYVSASADKSWSMVDLEGNTKIHVKDDAAFTCISFHPDGLLVGTGNTNGIFKIWDVCQQVKVAEFTHASSISAIAFSENGYYCASGDENGTTQIWDLRKLKSIQTLTFPNVKSVTSLSFDYTGNYLAIGSSTGIIEVINIKDWSSLLSFHDSKSAVYGVLFGKNASFVLSASGKQIHFTGLVGCGSTSLSYDKMNVDLK